MNADGNARFHDIDFWRGAGCLAMAIAHPLRVQVALQQVGAPSMPFLARLLVQAIDFGAVMFFFAAGANVVSFRRRRGNKPGGTAFYLASCALLFVMGYAYSLALGTLHLGVPDIFQGIALGTATTFLVLGVARGPAVPALVGVLILVVSVARHVAVPATEEGFASLGASGRFLFAHFSFFPWAGFVLLGASLYEARSRRALWAVVAVFAILFAWGFFGMRHQPIITHHQMLLRAGASYTTRYAGLSGLLMAALLTRYRGAGNSGVLRLLEFAGRESFLFLVHHFAILFLLLVWASNLGLWARAILTVLFSFATLPRLAEFRNDLAKRRRFLPVALGVLGVTFAAGLLALVAGHTGASMILGLPAAYAFAFTYPSLRLLLRDRLAPAAATAANPK